MHTSVEPAAHAADIVLHFLPFITQTSAFQDYGHHVVWEINTKFSEKSAVSIQKMVPLKFTAETTEISIFILFVILT